MANKTVLCACKSCKMADSCSKKQEPETLNIKTVLFYPINTVAGFHCEGYEKMYKVA